MTGWLCFTGWQSGLTAIAFLAGTIIQGLIVLNNPTYAYQNWHGTLLTIAVTAFSVLFNTVIASKLPLVEGLIVFLHIIGLFVVIIVLWTLGPRNNAHDAFLQYTNNGGWSSDGISLLVGLYPLVVSLIGFDSAVHMCKQAPRFQPLLCQIQLTSISAEEIADAARTLPKAIMWSTYLNALLGFVVVVTLIFTWGDMEVIAETPTGYPFLAVFNNTTNSPAGSSVLAAILIVTLTASCIAVVATASRQIWAFARDNGVPFSGFLRQVCDSSGSQNSVAETDSAGPPTTKRAYQRRPSIARGHRPPLPNQHRLKRSSQRNPLLRLRKPALFVRHRTIDNSRRLTPTNTGTRSASAA